MSKLIKIHQNSVVITTILIIFTASCKKEAPEATTIATSIELVSGNEQTGNVLTSLANPIVLIVKDQNGNSHAGTNINIAITEGSVLNEIVTTDANGKANIIWTLGPSIGKQTLYASANGLAGSPVEISGTGAKNICIDYDGNEYKFVTIGNQTWMAENLKATHYPNGEDIPHEIDNTVWGNLLDNNASDAYSYYNNNENKEAKTYGALYTYGAATGDNWARDVNVDQGICPNGWHLPTDKEWNELITYLGEDADSKLGGNADLWKDGNLDGNINFGTSGFEALPSGVRYFDDGRFENVNNGSCFWTATQVNAENASAQELFYAFSNIFSGTFKKSYGFSVRCIRD